MVSDTLSECADEIRRYLKEMPQVYADLKPRIDRLLLDMDGLRIELDTPPTVQRETE